MKGSFNFGAFVPALASLLAVVEGSYTESVTPKCDVVSVNSPWKRLSNGLELLFGNSTQDFERAQRLCKAYNANLPLESMIDSIRPCLRDSSGYYWLQTCSQDLVGRVFNVTDTRNTIEYYYHNYVCVITKEDIKTGLTIQVENQRNTTYSNKETKNIFQAWTGQTLNLFCNSALPNMLPRLCVKNGTSIFTCNNSNIMTWTPENCEGDITVTCELRHCPEDTHPAVQTKVSIKVKCPLEIMSFTSNTRYNTEGAHIYTIGEDVTFTCVTKGSSDVTIVKTQGIKMRETVVAGNHTYSITGFSCDDTGTYYCIAKQDDTQVNRSINIGVDGSCPPRLCPKETYEEGGSDISLISGQPVSVCVIAFPVLSDLVSFNGQNVYCGISSPLCQCSIKKSQHFMTYNFTFMIHNVSLFDGKKIIFGLQTEEQTGILNLTYNLNTNEGPILVSTSSSSSQISDNSKDNTLSTATGVFVGVIFIVVILLTAGLILCIFIKKKGRRHSHVHNRPLPLIPPNLNGNSNRRSDSTDSAIYSSVIEHPITRRPAPSDTRRNFQDSRQSQFRPLPITSRPAPIETRRNFQDSRQSQLRPLMLAEREPNANMYRYQNICGNHWQLYFTRRPAVGNNCIFCEQW